MFLEGILLRNRELWSRKSATTLALTAAALFGSHVVQASSAYAESPLSPPPPERVSLAGDGSQGNGDSGSTRTDFMRGNAALSKDGNYLAFGSAASNLVPGDTNGVPDIFVRNLQTGAVERVSVNSDEQQATGAQVGYGSLSPAISGDGRYVVYQSEATNLVPGASDGSFAGYHIYLRDRSLGTTELISATTSGKPAESSNYRPGISADGRFVTFHSNATNISTKDNDRSWDIYLRDRKYGTTNLVSVGPDDKSTDRRNSADASISASGRYISFGSSEPNLVAGDTDTYGDGFVKDMQTNEIRRIAIGIVDYINDCDLHIFGYPSTSISAGGRYSSFFKKSGGVTGDIIHYDYQSQTTSETGPINNTHSANQQESIFQLYSPDRNTVVFGTSSELATDDTNNEIDLYRTSVQSSFQDMPIESYDPPKAADEEPSKNACNKAYCRYKIGWSGKKVINTKQPAVNLNPNFEEQIDEMIIVLHIKAGKKTVKVKRTFKQAGNGKVLKIKLSKKMTKQLKRALAKSGKKRAQVVATGRAKTRNDGKTVTIFKPLITKVAIK